MGKKKKQEHKKEPKIKAPRTVNTEAITKRSEQQKSQKLLRLDMLSKCCTKLRIKRPELQKIVGTLNIHRLNDVLKDVYMDSKWYKRRRAIREDKAHNRKDSIVLASVETPITNEGRSESNESLHTGEST